MKPIHALVGGVVLGGALGLVCGYALHGMLRPPLGSARGTDRVLTSDLQLESACFFGASDSQLKGTLRPGSHVSIDWRKGNAAYISFQTVIAHDELERISRIVPSDEKMPP